MSIRDNIKSIRKELPSTTKLVAVSKFVSEDDIYKAYFAGQRMFGESRPQELLQKATSMPEDIEWHFIGNLQTNKLKMVLPYAKLIHSVDSKKLLLAIESYCIKNDLYANVLLEQHIAQEETKSGFSKEQLFSLFDSIGNEFQLTRVNIKGLMGMATFVEDNEDIVHEFENLVDTFETIKAKEYSFLQNFSELSFGMSGDYRLAIAMGSTLVRIGTSIFGGRQNYEEENINLI